MTELGIDDVSNISGLSMLIDTSNLDSNFNPIDLERQIRGELPTGETVDYTKTLNNILDIKVPDFESPAGAVADDSGIDEIMKSINSINSANVSHQTPQQSGQLGKSDPLFDMFSEPMTNEERRLEVVNSVIGEKNVDTMTSIENNRIADDKALKLEHISSLRVILTEEGEDLSGIPNVDMSNTLDEINEVYMHLLFKNDRKRCTTLAEEVIMLIVSGIEWSFDGRKSYFGYRPDMVDWSKTVQGKLRRMRHDTSNVANKFIKTFGFGSIARILLELVPSGLLYSQMRKSQHRDRLVSEDEYNAGINKFRNYDSA